jgi:hypothetical protein
MKKYILAGLLSIVAFLGNVTNSYGWTEEGSVSVSTWTEEGGGTASNSWSEEGTVTTSVATHFVNGVTFSSSVVLPTTANSISGAGSGSGLDADKLDGQHGSYYGVASSIGLSTASIQTELDASQLAIGISTAGIQSELDASQLAIGISTSGIQSSLDAVILSTGTLVKKSGDTMTGTLYTSSNIKVNTITEYTDGTGVTIERFENHYAGVEGNFPNIVDNGDGTIEVGTCAVVIYNNSNFREGHWFKTISSATLTPTDNDVSYVTVNWNSGTPVYQIVTLANRATINQSNIIPVYRLFEKDNSLDYYVNYGELSKGLPNKEADRLIRLRGIERESGLGISGIYTTQTSTRAFQVASGYMWLGLNRYTCDTVFSTDTTNCAISLWTKQGSDWIANNQWYQTDTTTDTVGINKIVTNWIYRRIDDCEIDIILGTESGDNLTSALERTEPTSKPPHLSYFYKLVGRILVVKDANIYSSIQSIVDTTLSSSFDSDHTHLTNIGTNTHAQIDTALTNIQNSTSSLQSQIYGYKVSPSTGINNGQLADGVKVTTANVTATGTPSASTAFLGDGTWGTLGGGGDVTTNTEQTITAGKNFTGISTFTVQVTFSDINTSDDSMMKLEYSTNNVSGISGITITVDGDVDKEYFIQFRSTGSLTGTIYFAFNSDTTAANYSMGYCENGAWTENNGRIVGEQGTRNGMTTLRISAQTGVERTVIGQSFGSDTANEIDYAMQSYLSWEDTSTNITSISLAPSTGTFFIKDLSVYTRR